MSPLHPAVNKRERILLYGPPKAGKALAIDTPIPTPTGWTTMKEIEPGDVILAGDGTATEVLWVSPTYFDHACYEVTFSDGRTLVADAEHRWFVRNRDYETSVMTTVDLAALPLTGDGRLRWAVPTNPMLDLGVQQLPIDPYVLGYWLGDGSTASSLISCAAADQPWLYARLEQHGYRPHATANANNVASYDLQVGLRMLGVLGNKHIPDIYLRAAPEQRLALLQGLMDSDGFCAENGQCEFTTTNPQLATAVQELIWTLGFKVRRRKDCGEKFRLFFTPHLPVFCLPRKSARQRFLVSPQTDERQAWLTVESVRPVDSVPTKCLSVAHPSHLFLAGDMIVTHNSTAWLSVAEWLEKTNADAKMFVLDSDNAWEIMGTPELEKRVVVYEVDRWQEWQDALKVSIPGQVDPERGDWLVVDMIDRMWTVSQSDYYVMMANDPQADALDIALHARKEGISLAGEYGINWSYINKMYGDLMGRILKFPGHVMALAPATDVRQPDSQGKGGDSLPIRDLYGRVGIKPQGQKELGYQFHSILAIQRKPNRDRVLNTIDERKRPGTEERAYLTGEVFKDFTASYLMRVGGWKVSKEEKA